MKETTFKEVAVHQRFFYDGAWYIKIDPIVPALNVFFNAQDDESNGYWFADSDIVEIEGTEIRSR